MTHHQNILRTAVIAEMDRQNMTLADLHRLTSGLFADSTVRRWLRGDMRISVDRAEKLCAALGLTITVTTPDNKITP